AATASAALAESTVKAALAFTTQATAAGLVSAKSAALVEAVAKQLFMTKLKVVTALLLAASTLIGASLLTHEALADKTAATTPAEAQLTKESPKQPATKRQTTKTLK